MSYKITKESSKEDEIAYLRKIAGTVEPGSYLGTLFSKELLEWTERQIRDDCPADIYGDYDAMKGGRNLAEQMENAATLEVKELRKLYETTKAERDRWKEEYHKEAEEANRLATWNSQLTLTADKVEGMQEAITEIQAANKILVDLVWALTGDNVERAEEARERVEMLKTLKGVF